MDVLVIGASMVVGWQRQVAIRKGPRVDSNFSVFYVFVFSDLCLYVSMVLCLYVSGKRGVAATYGYILGGSVA